MAYIIHKYQDRLQAELEAKEASERCNATCSVIKLADGRYGTVWGELDHADLGSAIAQYTDGNQIF